MINSVYGQDGGRACGLEAMPQSTKIINGGLPRRRGVYYGTMAAPPSENRERWGSRLGGDEGGPTRPESLRNARGSQSGSVAIVTAQAAAAVLVWWAGT